MSRRIAQDRDTDLSFEDIISVTNHGKEVFALLRWGTYESIAETLEIISDDDTYAELRKGIRQMQNNEMIDLDDLKKRLNV